MSLETIIIAIIVVIPAVLIIWFLFVILVIIYKILTRKKVLEKLAQQLNIELQQKDNSILNGGRDFLLFNMNKDYILNGKYLDKDVIIEESKIAKPIEGLTKGTLATSGDAITKKLIIKIDNKIILEQKYTLFLSLNEIKEVIDNYIKNGIIMKKSKSKLEIFCYCLLFFMIMFLVLFWNPIINLIK